MAPPKTISSNYFVSLLKTRGVHEAATWLLSQQPIVLYESNGQVDIERIITTCGIEGRVDKLASSGSLLNTKTGWQVACRTTSDPLTRRYTLAHELCHWLLHTKVGLDSAKARDLDLYEPVEEVCDVFAGMLLAPPQKISSELQLKDRLRFSDIERMARLFGVPLRAVLQSLRASSLANGPEQLIITLRPVIASGELRVVETCTSRSLFSSQSRTLMARGLGLCKIESAWTSFVPKQEYNYVEEIPAFDEVSPLGSPSRVLGCRQFEVAYRTFVGSGEGVFVVGLFWHID